MELVLDWLNLVGRWIHLIVGIAWIGSSFYFVWMDDSLDKPAEHDPDRDRLGGEIWMVHGGGFYHARKFKLAPPRLPEVLHWFKWEAYATWISGFAMLVIVYYAQAKAFLVPPGSNMSSLDAIVLGVTVLVGSWLLYDGLCRSPLGRNPKALAAVGVVLGVALCWGLTQLFTGRGALIHIGAAMGTIMAANVLLVIIPNQTKAVAQLIRGETPDPAYGAIGKQRSVHNTYLTLPVLLLMLSNHFPMVYQHRYNWLIVLGLSVIGGLTRQVFVMRHTHRSQPWMLPAIGVALLVVIGLTEVTAGDAAPTPVATAEKLDPNAPPAAPFAEVQAIVSARCTVCHSAKPSFPGIHEAPKGVLLDSPAGIAHWAPQIMQQAVLQKTMPLSNATNMQPEERTLLGRWISDGAHLPAP